MLSLQMQPSKHAPAMRTPIGAATDVPGQNKSATGDSAAGAGTGSIKGDALAAFERNQMFDASEGEVVFE